VLGFGQWFEFGRKPIFSPETKMGLFEIVPDSFFTVLASPLRRHYAEVLFAIYDKYRHITLGIPREAVVQEIVDYINKETATGDGAAGSILDEEDDDGTGGTGDRAASENPRAVAARFLRRLEKSGWIHVEVNQRFEEFVNLTDTAIQVLDALAKVRERQSLEYEGYVYTTYRLLEDVSTNPAAREKGHLILQQAYELTDRLVRNLKLLNHNIRIYINRLLEQKHPKDILELTLEGYKREILDQNYLQLKTSDNVSRYRPRILLRVNEWLNNGEWLAAAAAAQARGPRSTDQATAEAELRHRLLFIRRSYLEVDDILEEIDRKNSRYISVAVNHLQLTLTSTANTVGQLSRLITFLGAELAAQEGKKGEKPLPLGLERLFSLYPQSFIDVYSLYTPRAVVNRHTAPRLPEVTDESERAKARREFAQRAARRLSRDKVYAYVDRIIGPATSKLASEFPLSGLEDFIYLIAAALYSSDRSAPYTVHWQGERKDVDGFEFPEMVIRRKENIKI